MAGDLTTVMDGLVACVCSALEDIERAACSCGLTVGPPAPGPLGCCQKCGTGNIGGQVSAFVSRVYPADQTRAGITSTTRLENCNSGGTAADITITILRCYPKLDTKGTSPTLDQTTPYAHDMNTDLTAAWNALKCCGQNIQIVEAGADADVEGGCSAFGITVTTLVDMTPPPVDLDVS